MHPAINTGKYTLLAILAAICLACGRSSDQVPAPDRTPVIPMVTHFIIGLDDQPDEHLLGRPFIVRTDYSGNIYVADQASIEIKVFTENGRYIHSIGGRGRGPGEILGFGFMEITPDSNLVIFDTGNRRYTTISFDGKYQISYPYNFSLQFYPSSIAFGDGYLIGLMLDSQYDEQRPYFDRDLFYVYTLDFQTRIDSFGPYYDLMFEDFLPMIAKSFHPGSFVINHEKKVIFYSPGTYNGILFKYSIKNDSKNWKFVTKFEGEPLSVEPYILYRNEEEYQRKRESKITGVVGISGGGRRSIGRIIAIDSGIFLNQNNQVIQFYSVWADDLIDKGRSIPYMDLFVQIFDDTGNLVQHSFLMTYEERSNLPLLAAVNWMDTEGNFYMIEYMNEVPVVRKFSLEFPFKE